MCEIDFDGTRTLTVVIGDYSDDSNYSPSGGIQGIDDDSLSGAHGGSGLGQAGGYTGSQGRREGQKTFNDDDDNYCETDPGMAGNRGVQDTQNTNVPGVGRMGGEQETGWGQTVGGQGRSRGYERDNDEYDDSGFGQGAGAGASRAPKASMGSKVMG